MVDSDPHEELIKTKEDWTAKIQRVGMLIDWIFKTGWIFSGLCLDKMVGDDNMIPVCQISEWPMKKRFQKKHIQTEVGWQHLLLTEFSLGWDSNGLMDFEVGNLSSTFRWMSLLLAQDIIVHLGISNLKEQLFSVAGYPVDKADFHALIHDAKPLSKRSHWCWSGRPKTPTAMLHILKTSAFAKISMASGWLCRISCVNLLRGSGWLALFRSCGLWRCNRQARIMWQSCWTSATFQEGLQETFWNPPFALSVTFVFEGLCNV